MDSLQIDFWYTFCDRIDQPQLLEEYRRLLAPEEEAQWQRFRVERVKHQYLVTRALVRSVLSSYFDFPPDAWVFRRNAYGKPSVQEPAAPGLEFNLSHTQGLVVCAVARDWEVGVDVERFDRQVEHMELARRFFAPSEAAALEEAPAGKRPALFFRFWTLKESYIKAKGLGLSIPLDQFAFTLQADGPPRLALADPRPDRPDQWQFMELGLDAEYQVAIAIRVSESDRLEIQVRETVPLVRQGTAQFAAVIHSPLVAVGLAKRPHRACSVVNQVKQLASALANGEDPAELARW